MDNTIQAINSTSQYKGMHKINKSNQERIAMSNDIAMGSVQLGHDLMAKRVAIKNELKTINGLRMQMGFANAKLATLLEQATDLIDQMDNYLEVRP